LASILIVDIFEPWRRTIRTILEESLEWKVIGEALDGFDAVRKSQELQPDVILLEVGLPRLNGIEAARQISQVAPNSKIVFLSSHYGAELVREALKIGRGAYILKADAPFDLLRGLGAVIQDKEFVSSSLVFSKRTKVDGMLGC
jgi:DNA-binding NarL/FixJ family response regulator